MKVQYYNPKTKELDDRAIIKALKEAQSDYKCGAIIECRDTLWEIIKAINKFEREYVL